MTLMGCLSCGAEMTNGLALCETCRAAARLRLEYVPVYFRNLSRWKPGQTGSRRVPGSRIPLGVLPAADDPVAQLLDETSADVTGWARLLHDDRGVPLCVTETDADAVAAACGMLDAHLVSVSTVRWVGDFAHGIATVERRLRAVTERVVPGWYAGTCQREVDGAPCGRATYVVPGLRWVTCRGCGVTTDVHAHRATILEEARGWVATPMRLAEIIVALAEGETSVARVYERVKKWGQRGQLATLRSLDQDGDEVGPKQHRLGDVLDLLQRERLAIRVTSGAGVAS